MDNLMLEKIKELLAKNEIIGIAVGRNPGIDEMAGALSLYLALSSAGKKVSVVCPTQPIVEVSSLVGIDKVKRGFGGGESGDLTVSFPYEEGGIEKISYTLEDGKLNILVKAGENGLTFNEEDIEYKRGGGAPGLVFVIGTPRLSDLGTAFDMDVLKDSKVINIDYKSDNQGFGDVPLLGRNSSSVSELITSFISALGFKIDVDIAQNLLSGITSATDNFQKENTSSLSFEMAGILLKKGAVRERIGASKKQDSLDGDSFFTPKSSVPYAKPQSQAPTFAKKIIGTEEKKENLKLDAAFAKGFSEPKENNPPDDWLAPKIYKGSTSI